MDELEAARAAQHLEQFCVRDHQAIQHDFVLLRQFAAKLFNIWRFTFRSRLPMEQLCSSFPTRHTNHTLLRFSFVDFQVLIWWQPPISANTFGDSA